MLNKALSVFRWWFQEIRAVGIRDWLWFVVWLRRDEFHPRLNLLRYWPDRLDKLALVRNRAHRIDQLLEDLRGNAR